MGNSDSDGTYRLAAVSRICCFDPRAVPFADDLVLRRIGERDLCAPRRCRDTDRRPGYLAGTSVHAGRACRQFFYGNGMLLFP